MDKINATVSAAADAIFGKPLVTNVYRSVLVEAMVAGALKDWTWCSGDYAAYDFSHPNGLRLEVKQTAIQQTWERTSTPQPRWDIAPRTGYGVDGTKWVDKPGRNADIYVLALHPVAGERTDHRNPEQWIFYVVSALTLPAAKSISKTTLDMSTFPVPISQLAGAVKIVMAQCA